jgi:hypothetical protein
MSETGATDATRSLGMRKRRPSDPTKALVAFGLGCSGRKAALPTSITSKDHRLYGRAIESGSTVIAVTVESAESQRAMALLADQMPLELEDVGPASASDTTTAQKLLSCRRTSSPMGSCLQFKRITT